MNEYGTFEEWMAECDRLCRKISGVSIHDLPDQPFWDWWDDEWEPIRATRETLTESGF